MEGFARQNRWLSDKCAPPKKGLNIMDKKPLTLLDNKKILVAPSILASDFSKLGDEIRRVEKAGADIIHIDIMDGHFVPNLTLGPPLVESVRNTTPLPFDVHLMLTNPFNFVEPFAKAGADNITFHIECLDDIDRTIGEIRRLGCSVGLCVKPKTPVEKIFPFLEKIDLILIMTVEPGFGGQSFMSDMMWKVFAARDAVGKVENPVHVEVDGGIDERTAMIVAAAGANMIVAGTSVFRNKKGAEFAIAAIHSAQEVFKSSF